MNLRKCIVSMVGSTLFVVGFAGCYATVNTTPVVPVATTGFMTLHWSVDGTMDPNACYRHGATDLQLVVVDRVGNQVSTQRAPCQAFDMTVQLPPGDPAQLDKALAMLRGTAGVVSAEPLDDAANAKLLETQAATLLKLDEVLKDAQQLRTFARRT